METDFGPVDWSAECHHVLLNPRWPAGDLAALRERARLRLGERPRPPCVVLASSGTGAASLGDVKLIVISKAALSASARAVNARFGFGSADVFGRLLPEFHVGGLGILARAHLAGARVADLRGDGEWRPADVHARARAAGVSVLSLVPTQLHDLMALRLPAWPGLRCVFLGGAALPPDLESAARSAGWPVVATYGMTETSSMIAVRAEPDPSLGFEILPHAEAAVRDGRIAVRTAALAEDVAGPDGWFVTEDRGEIRDGRLRLHGRDRDQVKINGENVDVAALRAVFAREAAAFGVPSVDFHLAARPDARHGAVIVLFVAGGRDVAQARAAFDSKVLPFERIREIVGVREIPRSDLGKVREAALLASRSQED